MILFGDNNEIYDTRLSEDNPVGEYDYLTDKITLYAWVVLKTNEPKRQKIRDDVRAQLFPNVSDS